MARVERDHAFHRRSDSRRRSTRPWSRLAHHGSGVGAEGGIEVRGEQVSNVTVPCRRRVVSGEPHRLDGVTTSRSLACFDRDSAAIALTLGTGQPSPLVPRDRPWPCERVVVEDAPVPTAVGVLVVADCRWCCRGRVGRSYAGSPSSGTLVVDQYRSRCAWTPAVRAFSGRPDPRLTGGWEREPPSHLVSSPLCCSCPRSRGGRWPRSPSSFTALVLRVAHVWKLPEVMASRRAIGSEVDDRQGSSPISSGWSPLVCRSP